MKLLPEHAKLDAYYNLDNGTGKIRGSYLQGNDMARPIFECWFAPCKDLGAGTVTIRNTGGTDHLSFNAVGLPGFNFMQDQIEYSTRTHHSTMDLFDRLQKGGFDAGRGGDGGVRLSDGDAGRNDATQGAAEAPARHSRGHS